MFKKFGLLSLVLGGAMLLQPAATFAEGLHNDRGFRPENRGNVVQQYRETRTVREYRAPVKHRKHNRKHAEKRMARFHKHDYRR